jgi:hypothetical protein
MGRKCVYIFGLVLIHDVSVLNERMYDSSAWEGGIERERENLWHLSQKRPEPSVSLIVWSDRRRVEPD